MLDKYRLITWFQKKVWVVILKMKYIAMSLLIQYDKSAHSVKALRQISPVFKPHYSDLGHSKWKTAVRRMQQC